MRRILNATILSPSSRSQFHARRLSTAWQWQPAFSSRLCQAISSHAAAVSFSSVSPSCHSSTSEKHGRCRAPGGRLAAGGRRAFPFSILRNGGDAVVADLGATVGASPHAVANRPPALPRGRYLVRARDAAGPRVDAARRRPRRVAHRFLAGPLGGARRPAAGFPGRRGR